MKKRPPEIQPLPWVQNKYGTVTDANGETVLLRGFAMSCGNTEGTEVEANTNLAFAAPDLLAACAAAQEFLESGSGDLDEHQRHEARVKALLDAAVQKAKNGGGK